MQTLYIHPQNPQNRLIEQLVNLLKQDALAVIASKTGYVLAISLGAKVALDKVKQLCGLDDRHVFTLLCRDLSEVSLYATISNEQHRTLKAEFNTPSHFILPATKTTPKKLLNKDKAIAVAHDDTPIMTALLNALGEPLVIISMDKFSPDMPLDTPYDIEEQLGHQLDVLVDAGEMVSAGIDVVDLTH